MSSCIKCNDRGGFRDGFGRWRRCTCVTQIPAIRAQHNQRQLDLFLDKLREDDPAAYKREMERRLNG